MKVILIQDVLNLGKKGEIKEVSVGYASNFLIPKKKGIIATNKEVEKLKDKIKKEMEQKKRNEEDMKKIAEKINSLNLEIKERVDESGTLYGSVDKKKIAELLKNNGIEIDQEKIRLFSYLKKIGKYEVEINLLPGTMVRVNIIIKASA